LKRIEDLRTTLDQLEAGQANAISLRIVRQKAAVRLVAVFAKSVNTASVGAIFLDVGFARPILDEPELQAVLMQPLTIWQTEHRCDPRT